MPRKKSGVEIIQSEKQPKRKTVAAKHTITYEAPVDVPITEDETDPDSALIEDVDVEEIEEAEDKQPPYHVRVRQKLRRRGISGDETLALRIDRLPNFEVNGFAGVKADKEFCGVITCTEKFFDNENHLIEIQRRYGPGVYWLALRYKNAIVDSWRIHIGGFSGAPASAEVGQAGPQVIYQPMPNQAQQPVAVQDPLTQLRQAFKIVREFKDDLGFVAPQETPQAPPPDPEVVLLQNLANNDKFMDKVTNGVVGKVLGKGAIDDEPSWAAVGMEAVKSGQVAVAIDAIGKVALNLVDRIFPRSVNNGQAQVAQTPLPHQPADQGAQVSLLQGQQEGIGGHHQSEAGGYGSTELPQGVQNQPQTTPGDPYTQMMTNIITILAANGPVEDAIKHVDGFLFLNPTYTEVVNNQLSPAADKLLGGIATIPGCEQIAQAPHAKQWIEQFQEKFFEEGEGEE